MGEASSSKITRLLDGWSRGDRAALDQLVPLVYDELHRLAGRQLRQERPNHTLQPTALVHEAYVKLIDQRRVHWKNRAHFFGVAARLMRRVLVDHARSRLAAKRGGGEPRVSLDHAETAAVQREVPLLALDDALVQLEAVDPVQSQIVELRYFGGLSIEETAAVVGVSEATIGREWNLAKAWLFRELEPS
jgi:RNA polymerase sigma factor (TIGR02999 family)